MESGVLAGVLDQVETVLPKHIQVSDCGAVGAVTTQSELSSFVRKINTSQRAFFHHTQESSQA